MDLRSQILASADIQQETVFVPEWGTPIVVKGMTGLDREKFEANYEADKLAGLIRGRLAAYCCHDAEGNRLFAEADIPALAAKSASALTRIFNSASRLSGITREDREQLEGN